MISECKAADIPEPRFSETNGVVKIEFELNENFEIKYNPEKLGERKVDNDTIENYTEKDTEKQKISEKQKIILNVISKNSKITASELVEVVGINLRNVKLNISKLVSTRPPSNYSNKCASIWFIAE